MIIGKAELPKDLKIPRAVVTASKSEEVDIDSNRTYFDAATWVTCQYVWPHNDIHSFSEVYFLSLTVLGDHHISDVFRKDKHDGGSTSYADLVEPGTIFVIDPRVSHWLVPACVERGERIIKSTPGFACLQWEIPREGVKKAVSKIMQDLKAQWRAKIHIDTRFRGWHP